MDVPPALPGSLPIERVALDSLHLDPARPVVIAQGRLLARGDV